ncbi:MAG TPA: hypothetical protein VFX12_00370 [Vicinamibacterales bacterium]|nr:hypothetical protein [Vicinamibacterales bacterium]
MLVYREDGRPAETEAIWRQLRRVAAHLGAASAVDATQSLLIDAGEFEAAAVDGLSPGRDEWGRAAEALRRVTEAAADAWLDAASAVSGGVSAKPLLHALDAVPLDALPSRLSLRVPEGYAYYGLFPWTYSLSARAWLDAARPRTAVCIGLRSIGTSLSAAVATTLRREGCDVWTCTVRPRGHPFDRRLSLGEGLRAIWRERAAAGARFAIVDEGPGISGSSFAAAIEAVADVGVPADRIVLFPAWDPDPSQLSCDRARRLWRSHRRYWTDAARAGVTPERIFGVNAAVDWSAGRWRAHSLGDERQWPAAHPRHERWKVFAPDVRAVIKFVGLGRYGERAQERAAHLHACGLGPAPDALRSGFLATAWVDGHPLERGSLDAGRAAIIGRYIGRVAAMFPAERQAGISTLRHMIDVNAREAFGGEAAATLAHRHTSPAFLEDAPAAALDARMLPHEWLATDGGLMKVDALEHHADHFFPGVQDAAWDLAACLEEFDAPGTVFEAMIDACVRASGDAGIRARLPFFRAAYTAFRLGYATQALADLAGTAEARRFTHVRTRARAGLAAALHLTSPSVP